MSNLYLSNLGNLAGTSQVPIEVVLQGAAKSWLNMNGTGTIATRDSFNVSSLVDNGVGDYSVNFATVHPSANYGFTMLSGGTASAGFFRSYDETRSRTAGQVSFVTANTSATLIDTAQISAQSMGDPA